ncbi:hypothetical protein B296_00033440 [Ensete ventricosum]|uniref:Uncharacterized protein n=1 Tax=Ensete ventricosum TaxID=4639 RepID=A0A426YSZ9_ENSVE|nr:hypothetical protein B296_00033440 [Ensete ventricosum]
MSCMYGLGDSGNVAPPIAQPSAAMAFTVIPSPLFGSESASGLRSPASKRSDGEMTEKVDKRKARVLGEEEEEPTRF